MVYQKGMHKVLCMASALYITPLKGVNKQDWYVHNDTKAKMNCLILRTQRDRWMVCLRMQEMKSEGTE